MEYFSNSNEDSRFNPISINQFWSKGGNRKPAVKLVSSNTNFINTVLIPFFDQLTFHSKKEMDFIDWKTISKLKAKGWHHDPNCVPLILALSYRMNNYRLSTNKQSSISNVNSLSNEELDKQISALLNKPSNLELHNNGKIWVKSSQTYLARSTGVKIIATSKDESFNEEFLSFAKAALYFGTTVRIIRLRLESNAPLVFKGQNIYLKCILVDSSLI